MAYDQWGNWYDDTEFPGGDHQSNSDPVIAPPTAPPAGPVWTDPDTAMPDWLHDPSADMSGHPLPPGLRWVFQNGMWQTVQSLRDPDTTSNPNPGGTNTGGTNTGDYHLPSGGYAGGGFQGGRNPYYDAGSPPELNLPRFGGYPEFKYTGKAPSQFAAPSMEDAKNEPGYQFRLEQGQKALEQSAAAKGVLRTGGTLKDVIGYGQNFASAEYGNVYNRRAGEHDRDFREYLGNYDLEADTYAKNYGVKRDTFDRDYQATLAEYQPKLVGWQQNASAHQREAELQFGREWDEYVFTQNQMTQAEKDAYQAEQDRLNRLERQSQPKV